MTVLDVSDDDVSSLTLVTTPTMLYVSGSSGVTGSAHVYARRSSAFKDVPGSSPYAGFTTADDDNAFLSLKQAKEIAQRSQTSNNKLFDAMDQYMRSVNEINSLGRLNTKIDIIRMVPTYTFTANTSAKLMVKDVLMPEARTRCPSANWAFTNYNALNFYTGSSVPSDAALLYPNVGNVYQLTGSFTFDFHVNVRRGQDTGLEYRAGSLFHLSSSYVVSIVSGSSRDAYGRADEFRLMLQLSSSADLSPSSVNMSVPQKDLIFLSSNDNTLRLNTWHHVSITWGTSTTDRGVGNFYIDGTNVGNFTIPSSSINTNNTCYALAVGNYYEGTNTGSSTQSYFFAKDPATRDGVSELNVSTGVNEPTSYSFTHPLCAEVHDLCIMNRHLSLNEISVESSELDPSTVFYVPPFFVHDVPLRRSVNGFGGVLQTPFFEVDGTTTEPSNVAMSFGVGGHYVNLENFVKDFSNEVFPRLHKLSGTAITTTTGQASADEFLYSDPFVRYRNTVIVPCDDGNYAPKFGILDAETDKSLYVDDLGLQDYSLVNLSQMVATASLYAPQEYNGVSTTDFSSDVYGFTPEDVTASPGPAYVNYMNSVKKAIANGSFTSDIQKGAPLTIFQRTLDASSNEITMFDVSNLFYGDSIYPGSLKITSNLTGSNDAVSITLADDGVGNLYRADSLSKHASWSTQGNVFYSEGLILVKSPLLQHFGKDGYTLTFKGMKDIHVLRIESIAKQNEVNVSTNVNYHPVSASQYPTDTDSKFVYISGINYHDSDFNVVLKSQLAQPVMKRNNSRILFVSKYDW